MINRAFRIIVAVVCLAALCQLAAVAQAVIVDNGAAAEDYTAVGQVAGVTTGVAGVTITGNTTITGANTLTVGGLTTLSGGAAITGPVTGSGLATFDSLAVTNNATVGGTFGVTGATTLTGPLTANGGATVHNGASLFSGNGAVTDNRVIVNGTGASIGSQFSGLSVNSTTNAVSLVSDTDLLGTNARGALTMTPTTASLSVNTNAGLAHGVGVGQTNTVISGGAAGSTSLTLDDNGARFSNNLGGPTRLTGVANGVAASDAVNVGQFDRGFDTLSGGIASIAALAAIPYPVTCKNYSIGFGYGNYKSQSAYAVGFRANVPKTFLSFTAGAGFTSNSSPAYNGGIGYSF